MKCFHDLFRLILGLALSNQYKLINVIQTKSKGDLDWASTPITSAYRSAITLMFCELGLA